MAQAQRSTWGGLGSRVQGLGLRVQGLGFIGSIGFIGFMLGL